MGSAARASIGGCSATNKEVTVLWPSFEGSFSSFAAFVVIASLLGALSPEL